MWICDLPAKCVVFARSRSISLWLELHDMSLSQLSSHSAETGQIVKPISEITCFTTTVLPTTCMTSPRRTRLLQYFLAGRGHCQSSASLRVPLFRTPNRSLLPLHWISTWACIGTVLAPTAILRRTTVSEIRSRTPWRLLENARHCFPISYILRRRSL